MTGIPNGGQSADDETGRRRVLLLLMAYLGFVSLGLPDAVAGVAWPSVRETFILPQSGFGLIFIALGCGYCISSFFGGKLTQTLGVGTLLTVSSLFVAIAMFGCASAPIWQLFVACAVVWGCGSGAIDAGLNAYASHHFSARHVNWLHACYSLGATLGPLLMTAMLVSTGTWRLGYAVVGSIMSAMAVTFLATRQKWSAEKASPQSESHNDDGEHVTLRHALFEPLVWLQVAVFFLYTGLEFTVGQWSFTVFTESRGMRTDVAGVLAGSYFGAIGVGRVLFGFIVDRVGLDRLIRCSMLTALAGAVLFNIRVPATVGFIGLLLIGLGLAPIFPCMMTRTPQRLGAALAAHAVGFQVSAAMLGAALIPAGIGLLIERWGLETVAQIATLLAALLWATHELLLYRSRPRS